MKKSYIKRKISVSRRIFRVFNTLIMIFLVLSVILPFCNIISQSLMNHTVGGITILPIYNKKPDIDLIAYFGAFKYDYFTRATLVSGITTAATTFFGLLITSISAYILIQNDLPGKKLFAYMIIITLAFNAGLIPLFLVMKKIKLLNTLWAVILPLSINAHCIFLMWNYYKTLPKEIFDSAEIDGCTPVNTFLMIVLPMSKAALAAIGLFFAAEAWNEYYAYVAYISNPYKFNMQINMRSMFADWYESPEWSWKINIRTMQAAWIIVISVPMVILSLFAQKFYTPEFTMASVKE